MDLRPVQWDPALTKGVEKFITYNNRLKVVNEMKPCQVSGSNVKGGIEIACHFFRFILQKDHGALAIHLDSNSAFQKAHTKDILSIIAKKAPVLFPFIYSKYRKPSNCIFPDNFSVTNYAGVTQGGPCSMEIFNLIIADRLEDIHPNIIASGTHIILIVDDAFMVVGSRVSTNGICPCLLGEDVISEEILNYNSLRATFSVLMFMAGNYLESLSQIGLTNSEKKMEIFGYDLDLKLSLLVDSELWPTDSNNTKVKNLMIKSNHSVIPSVRALRGGMIIGGIPVGTDYFERDECGKVIDKVIGNLSIFQRMKDQCSITPSVNFNGSLNQALLELITLTTTSRFIYLARCVPPSNTKEQTDRLNNAIIETCLKIVGISEAEVTPLVRLKLILNKSKGGLGIPQICPYATYVGSLALTIAEVKTRFYETLSTEHFCSIPCLTEYTVALNKLSSTVQKINNFTHHQLKMQKLIDSLQPDKILVTAIPKIQHTLWDLTSDYLRDFYISTLPRSQFKHTCQRRPQYFFGRNDLVKILDAQCNDDCHYFLGYDKCVEPSSIKFDDESFNYLVRRRAGIYTAECDLILCPHCDNKGRKKLLTDNHHEVCVFCQPLRSKLHNVIQTIFTEFCKEAGFIFPETNTSRESSNTSDRNKFLPETKRVSNFLPEEFYNKNATIHNIKNKYCDLALCYPEEATKGTPLKRLAIIDFTLSASSAFGKETVRYNFPGYQAMRREKEKIKLYQSLFNFDSDPSNSYISKYSLVILAFETNGQMSFGTRKFIKFLSACLAKRDPYGNGDPPSIWYSLIIKKIQQAIALYMAKSYSLCHNGTPQTNNPTPNHDDDRNSDNDVDEDEDLFSYSQNSQSSRNSNNSFDHTPEGYPVKIASCSESFNSFASSTSRFFGIESPLDTEEECVDTNPWSELIFDFVPNEDKEDILRCINNPRCYFGFCDGSFTIGNNLNLPIAGYGAAIYNNINSNGIITDPRVCVKQDSGSVAALFPDFPLTQIDNIIAEIAGVYSLLLLFKQLPDHEVRPFLIRYDCEPAITLIRRRAKCSSPHLLDIVELVASELDSINSLRRLATPNGINSLSARDTNMIIFQHTRSHIKHEDLGIQYVDQLAKNGAC